MYEELFEIFRYSVPSIVVGAVFYLFFMKYFKNEDSRRNYLLFKDTQKITIPQRLQAYERIVLLLERINPKNLLVRLNVNNTDLSEYRVFLIDNINKEFDHNITQQLYISDETWEKVLESKIMCINMINSVFKESVEKENPLKVFKDSILEILLSQDENPTKDALNAIKFETKKLYKF